jgi:hypothetical protein
MKCKQVMIFAGTVGYNGMKLPKAVVYGLSIIMFINGSHIHISFEIHLNVPSIVRALSLCSLDERNFENRVFAKEQILCAHSNIKGFSLFLTNASVLCEEMCRSTNSYIIQHSVYLFLKFSEPILRLPIIGNLN